MSGPVVTAAATALFAVPSGTAPAIVAGVLAEVMLPVGRVTTASRGRYERRT